MPKRRPPANPPSTQPAPDLYRPDPSETYKSRQRWTPQDDESRLREPRLRDSYRPGRDDPKEREWADLPPVRSGVTKTKHERKNNPSTRIHSLKKQLQTRDLPGTIRQERERELATLLFEQEQSKLKQDARKNLQRYHFVRHLEKQRAERSLKKLMREKDACNDEIARKELEKQIHITEVDLNYAKYAPLGDKYISLFPKNPVQDKEQMRKRKKFEMNRLDFAILSEDQQKELRTQYAEAADLAPSATGDKPPLWYQIEKLMKDGDAQLEALRDGKLTTTKTLKANLTARGKEDPLTRTANGRNHEEVTPDWLNDDGVIDPADLDSDQDQDMDDGGFFEG
ncbi:rRNA-processing protein efg1 [Cladophialophora chaetospira]|uniref:rRNA-processing protein EFG1 n=1 Tax=Cladophialophora chaetospira TaxID=386627 RepID=A0AA38X915_9EURO|nr:rRNA-processing protein efg1 [Cladophialophora chaetospira]